jgi:hypothetical protein
MSIFKSFFVNVYNLFTMSENIVVEETRYALPAEGNLETKLNYVNNLAIEIVEKIRTFKLRDKSKCTFSEAEKKMIGMYAIMGPMENLYSWHKVDRNVKSTVYGFDVDIDWSLIIKNYYHSYLDNDLRIKLHKRIFKSIKKYNLLMTELMEAAFDFDNCSETETKYAEEWLGKLGSFQKEQFRKLKRNVDSANGKLKVTFVEGFVAQGKTSYLEDHDFVSWEMSEAFRIPLKEKVNDQLYLPWYYYDMFVLWGLFLSLYINKEEFIPKDVVVEKYVERLCYLNRAFDLGKTLERKSAAINLDDVFVNNLLFLNNVDSMSIKYFLNTWDNETHAWREEPISSWDKKRAMEKEVYADYLIEHSSDRHHFLKLLLLFHTIGLSYDQVDKIKGNKEVISIGGCYSLLPKRSEQRFFISKNYLGDSYDENDFYQTICVPAKSMNHVPKKQPWLIYYHPDGCSKCLIDDSYEHGAMLKYKKMPEHDTGAFIGSFQFLPVDLVTKEHYHNIRPVPFLQKTDSTQTDLYGFKQNNILNDGIDVLLANPFWLSPTSEMVLDIEIEPTYARRCYFCMRSRYTNKLEIQVEGATNKIRLINISNEDLSFYHESDNKPYFALFQFVPSKKVLDIENLNDYARFYHSRLIVGKAHFVVPKVQKIKQCKIAYKHQLDEKDEAQPAKRGIRYFLDYN